MNKEAHLSDFVKYLTNLIQQEGDLKVYAHEKIFDKEGDYAGDDCILMRVDDIPSSFDIVDINPRDYDYQYRKFRHIAPPLPEEGMAAVIYS